MESQSPESPLLSASSPDEPAADAPVRRRRRRRRRPSGVTVGIVAVAVVLLLRLFVAEPFRIPSESMRPTLKPGDQALVEKLAKEPRIGDLVAFHAPRTGEILLKRVVALPGDQIGIEDGVLARNGKLIREAYADPKSIDSVYYGPTRVPAGSIFVLGDNRANSEDSRNFGPVPTSRIIGRAVARIWPPAR